MNPKIRSIDVNNEGNLLIGTRGSEIILFDNYLKGNNPQVLIRGHFNDELWGLCVHPKLPIYYTVGYDCMLAA